MDECDEVAESIWLHNTTSINTHRDAEAVAHRYLADQGAQIEANVAEALWRRALRRNRAHAFLAFDKENK